MGTDGGKRVEKGLVETELSRLVIGLIFEVYNQLSYGLSEKIYQAAFEEELRQHKIRYHREKYGKIRYKEKIVGRYFIDFVIEDKIAVELKVRNEIYQTHINQLLNYIKSENYPIGLLLAISKQGVLIKRLVN